MREGDGDIKHTETDPAPETDATPARSSRVRSSMMTTSVHASVANEIGLRIVRGDYPPGTILPDEDKVVEDLRRQPLGGARGDQEADGEKPACLAAEDRQPA